MFYEKWEFPFAIYQVQEEQRMVLLTFSYGDSDFLKSLRAPPIIFSLA